jgi:hypothetical protein
MIVGNYDYEARRPIPATDCRTIHKPTAICILSNVQLYEAGDFLRQSLNESLFDLKTPQRIDNRIPIVTLENMTECIRRKYRRR